MTETIIEASALGFRYGSRWIFRHHSFSIERGRVIAVLGPNGRGKTTLIKTIVGLLSPTEGKAIVRGTIGYVPQSAGSAFSYSVLDMVVMGRARHVRMFSTPSSTDFNKAKRALEELNIGHLAQRPFDTLSGGERQLTLIARALASDCEILVLDEPASALDFKNQDTILRTLQRVRDERKITVILTTHYPQHALFLADDSLLMFSASHFSFGPCQTSLTEEQLSALYGMPFAAIPVPDGKTQMIAPLFGL
ncbi:MAG: ABC transporter ATP-binding protein [Pseudomonadota bacterium]